MADGGENGPKDPLDTEPKFDPVPVAELDRLTMLWGVGAPGLDLWGWLRGLPVPSLNTLPGIAIGAAVGLEPVVVVVGGIVGGGILVGEAFCRVQVPMLIGTLTAMANWMGRVLADLDGLVASIDAALGRYAADPSCVASLESLRRSLENMRNNIRQDLDKVMPALQRLLNLQVTGCNAGALGETLQELYEELLDATNGVARFSGNAQLYLETRNALRATTNLCYQAWFAGRFGGNPPA